MTAHVYFASHGTWYPAHGFARVPPNVEVRLYSDFMKTLDHGAAMSVLRGLLTEPLRTADAGSAIPNFYLTPLDQHFIVDLREAWQVGKARGVSGKAIIIQSTTSVSVVLNDCLPGGALGQPAGNPIVLHLLCCQVVALKAVGGRAHGVNASDTYGFTGLPGRYHIFERDSTGAKRNERWVS